MNRSDNPYTPGAGWKPRKLAGREAELDQFQLLLERMTRGDYEPSPIFTGLRGVGKTVLLLECEALAREAGWATHDVYEVGSQADFRITFAKLATILLRSMSLKQRMKKRALAALGVVKAFAEFAPPGFRFRLEIAPTVGKADSGDPEEDLADLLDEIGQVARAGGTGAVFLIDELQNLDSLSLAAVSVAFQRMVKKNLPVALVGAGLPTVSDGLFAAKGYSDRLFNHFELGELSRAAARTALISPAGVLGVKYAPEAVEYILDETQGYPYFIQEYGRVAWNESAESPIGLPVVRVVRDTVRERLADNFYGRRFTGHTPRTAPLRHVLRQERAVPVAGGGLPGPKSPPPHPPNPTPFKKALSPPPGHRGLPLRFRRILPSFIPGRSRLVPPARRVVAAGG